MRKKYNTRGKISSIGYGYITEKGYHRVYEIKGGENKMIISKEQYEKLPKEYQDYFERKVGDASSDGYIKNIHPT